MRCHSCGTEVAPDRSSAWSAARRSAASPTSPARCRSCRRRRRRDDRRPDRRSRHRRRPATGAAGRRRHAAARPHRRRGRTAQHRRREADAPTSCASSRPRPRRSSVPAATARPAGEPAPPPRARRSLPAPAAAHAGVLRRRRHRRRRAHDVVADRPAARRAAAGLHVNDFGTNNTVAALLAAATMLVGALVWCAGHRWGAGLAGGAGAALAGWVALLIGLAEWRHRHGEAAGPAADITRVGYWTLCGRRARRHRAPRLARPGRAGPPRRARPVDRRPRRGVVRHRRRRTADPAGHGRLVGQLELGLARCRPADAVLRRPRRAARSARVCGVVGFLLVRRWGLGLAVGGALAAGWLLVTAATDRTASPIGPAYANPGSHDLDRTP